MMSRSYSTLTPLDRINLSIEEPIQDQVSRGKARRLVSSQGDHNVLNLCELPLPVYIFENNIKDKIT